VLEVELELIRRQTLDLREDAWLSEQMSCLENDNLVLEGEEHGLTEASRVVSREGGEILGIGTYREKIGENPVCYLRLLGANADQITESLRRAGFDVLGVHRIGGIDF
jgi:hypothetical protein